MSNTRDPKNAPALRNVVRGPAGTELMGVSVAIPAKETLDPDTGRAWSQADWQTFIRASQPQLLEKLREHVGGTRFQTEPGLSLDGPHMDLVQGPIYVLTVSAWFNPHALPVDCPAYRARAQEARRA